MKTHPIRSLRLLGILTLALLAIQLAHPDLALRAEAAWSILFNGEPSKLSVIDTPDGQVVPVYFPAPKEGRKQIYGVQLETDPITMQIKVTRVEKKRQTRAPGDCPKCVGSKKCNQCYTAGSGINYAGNPCVDCNATGDCPYCRGSGICYMCDGRGYPNGCTTCGQVSKP